MLANSDITIYNRYLDSVTGYDKYSRCVVYGVNWFSRTKINITDGGLLSANEYTLRIPLTAKFGKRYTNPKDFTATNESVCFTLKEGDIIVRGITTETNPVLAELFKNYNEVLTVVSVTDNRRGSPGVQHFKVVGK